MITIQELKKKSANLFNEVLSAEISGISIFPKSIRANKELSEDFSKIADELSPIIGASKDRKGFGFVIKYEKIKTRKHGLQDIPVEFAFETITDYLKFVGKEKEFEFFKKDINLLITRFPQLKEWAIKYPSNIIDHHVDWPDLIKVCEWFVNYFEPKSYYIRELPIQVHTKFIENNKGIIRNLLDVLLPDKMNQDEVEFEKRYNLKYSEPLIRIRFIDKSITSIENVTDLSFTIAEFEKIKIDCTKVFITENLMNFLTFPFVFKSIVIWGGGFRVENLKNIRWLMSKEIYYWGDLDSHGMQILSQLRAYYPDAIALMMDKDTLSKFQSDWGTGKTTNVSSLNGLSQEEQKLFIFLKEQNIRLEQEKIPQSFVIEKTKNL